MKFYKISCWILAGVFAVVLVLTLLSNQNHYRKADPDSVVPRNCGMYYIVAEEVRDTNGNVVMQGGYVRVSDYLQILSIQDQQKLMEIENDYTKLGTFYETYQLFDGVVLLTLLGVVAALLIVCVCISQIYGGKTYKLGFFVLHIGLAVLLIGFIMQNVMAKSVSFYLDVNSNFTESTVFTDYQDAQLKLDLGVELSAYDIQVSRYENGMVKEYELYLEAREGIDQNQTMQYTLKINEPIRINGHKIYLMSYAEADPVNGYFSDTVALTAKYNPMEYTIIIGMLTTLAGTIVMCLFRKDGGKNDE